MRVMSYNTLLGGYDGDDDSRYHKLVAAVNEARPDVLMCQELQHYLRWGQRRNLRFERDTGLRGFLAFAPHTDLHTAVYIGPGVKPISFEAESTHFWHSAAMLTAEAPGFDRPVTFVSIHLCPAATPARIQEAAFLMAFGAPDAHALLAGDFNTLSPFDPERENFWGIPTHHRARHLTVDGKLETRPMDDFEMYGLKDVAAHLGKNLDYTVPSDGHAEGNFCRVRLDYFLASADLLDRFSSYQVVKTPNTDVASDHFPIMVEMA
ncbi:MAG TPA: endonuclease/exonuclease/phosphatase family protein [Fimbriimonas sp.]